MKKYRIVTIGGDGIGPEVVNETKKLLSSTGLDITFEEAFAGYDAYKKYDTPLPEETVSLCKDADGILFGAVTTPPNIKDYFSPIVRLRKQFELFANVRPMISLPVEHIQQGINFTIIRENTEDLYTGREHLTEEGAVAERVITKKGSERILRYAFEYAKKHNRKKVTVVHKANVLRLTDGLFLEIAQRVAKDFQTIEFQHMLVDSCAMQMIKNPTQFDVIVTTNMFGDILSDEAAALVGGLGVVASANIGAATGLFEPVHGSAPKYVGKHTSNPLATFFAACMMLEYLGEDTTSKKIQKAIFNVLKKGQTTKDLGGKLTTQEFTDTVINLFSK